MQDIYIWRCPICNYKTFSQDKRREHLQEMEADPMHIVIQDNKNLYINPYLIENNSLDEFYGFLVDFLGRNKDESKLN